MRQAAFLVSKCGSAGLKFKLWGGSESKSKQAWSCAVGGAHTPAPSWGSQ